MRAYHFVGKTLRDGRPVPPNGKWLVHDGPIVMCESGLHASEHPFDALKYAPGTTLCLVEIEAEPANAFLRQNDKVCGNRRRIIKKIDAERMLCEFARWCALRVIHLWEAPDVVILYLKTGDDSIREEAKEEARAASWAAASEAAAAASEAEAKE